MAPPNEQYDYIDTMMVASMVQQAETEVLLALCEMLARRLGIDKVDGLALIDWFQRQKVSRMDGMLTGLEDSNPALAAKFQKIIDDSKKRLGMKSSDEM